MSDVDTDHVWEPGCCRAGDNRAWREGYAEAVQDAGRGHGPAAAAALTWGAKQLGALARAYSDPLERATFTAVARKVTLLATEAVHGG